MADTPAAKPFPIPLSYFGIALGTAGLGMSWRYAATVGQAPAWPGESLLALAGVVWLLLMLAWFTKFLAFRQAFRADFQDLVQCCFISLIPITTIMSGLSLRPYAAAPAEVLIHVGIVGQLVFAMYRAAGLWRGLHTSKATTPIIYLPTVATSFVSAMAMSAMQQPEIATLFFGAGVLSWMSLEAAILGRLRTETAVDPKVRGIIGIQLQSTAFYNKLSLREQLKMFGSLYGTEVDTDALLSKVQLTEKADSYVEELSGGQKKRVFLARALAQQAQVILLDEPGAMLDAPPAGQLRAAVDDICARIGATLVVADHDISGWAGIVERLVVTKRHFSPETF
mgnify:CR=1 FL=1